MSAAQRLSLIAAALLTWSACDRSGAPRLPQDDLVLVPGDAAVVFRADLRRLRASPSWPRLMALTDEDPARQHGLAELTRRTGLDPARQIQSVLLALSSGDSEFALVVRGGPFDEERLAAYARDQLQQQRLTLKSTEVAARKIYSDGRDRLFVALLDRQTAVVGSKRWTTAIVELAGGVRRDHVLGAAPWSTLLEKVRADNTVRGDEAMWAAALVSDELRARIGQDPRLRLVGSCSDAYATADLTTGLRLVATLGLPAAGEAGVVATRASALIDEAKTSQAVQVLGLGSYLQAIRVEARNTSLSIQVALTAVQVDDLLSRVAALRGGASERGTSLR